MPTTQDSHMTSDTEPTSTAMHTAAMAPLPPPPTGSASAPPSQQIHAPALLEPTTSVSRRPPTVIFSRAPSMEAAHSQGRIINTNVEALEKEMEVFLRNHIAKLLTLQESLPLKDMGNPNRDNDALNTLQNGPGKRFSVQPGNQPAATERNKFGTVTDIQNGLSSHKHVNRLESFLANHIMVLQNLRNGLLLQFPSDESSPEKKPDVTEINKAYEAVGSQLTMQVVISTFASSLIISFLSLVQNIVDSQQKAAWSVGLLISLFAMCVHLANIIVAGRGAALASEATIAAPSDPHSSKRYGDKGIKYFRFYLALCEQLQFLATILFVISIAVLIFIMFRDVAWAVVVIWFAVILAFGVFCLGYWKVSMTSKNVKYIAKMGGRGWMAFKKGMWS